MEKDAHWEARVAQERLRLEERLAGLNVPEEELEKRRNELRGDSYPPLNWKAKRLK